MEGTKTKQANDGFIEVTDKESGRKVLVKVSEIQAVFDEGMMASICIVSHIYSPKNTHFVIYVEETYWEVKELLSKAESEEVVREEHGIITECSKSERCAAVTGIMEAEIERRQLRKEYDKLRERYKNLSSEYEDRSESFECLKAEYEDLKKECEAHWRQLTQIMRSNPEVFEQFSGDDEIEQELIDAGILVK